MVPASGGDWSEEPADMNHPLPLTAESTDQSQKSLPHEVGAAKRDSLRSPTPDLGPDALLGPGTAHVHPSHPLLLAEQGPQFTDHREGHTGAENRGDQSRP